MAVPVLVLEWNDPGDGSHFSDPSLRSGEICLHDGDEAVFTPSLRPSLADRFYLDGLTERGPDLVLSVPTTGRTYSGTASLAPGSLAWGSLTAMAFAHRCDSSHDAPYCSICGHYEPDDLELSVRSPLTLKHDNQTSISIIHAVASGESHPDGTIEIRRKGTNVWETLGSESSLSPWTARIAGTFELRGTATINGRSFETPIAEVEVRFPTYDQIVSDQTVALLTDTEWSLTLSDCTTNSRRERGFWIALDTANNTYVATSQSYGQTCDNSQTASVYLPPRPNDTPSNPGPTEQGAVYSVASFHTHTPTTYRSVGRPVGPSAADRRADSLDQVPGIVYDFIEATPGSGRIPPGHLKTAPAMRYKSLGLERRPTP